MLAVNNGTPARIASTILWYGMSGWIERDCLRHAEAIHTTDQRRTYAMAWARCILTVTSLVPNSLAICLFNIAGNHQLQHFTFSWRQGIIPAAQFGGPWPAVHTPHRPF